MRRRHLALLVSLTMYVELEGRMIPQNDTLDEADRPSYQEIFWPLLALCLVSLTIYIELEGRMIPQNDTLVEADRASY